MRWIVGARRGGGTCLLARAKAGPRVKPDQLFVAACVLLVKGKPAENAGLIFSRVFASVDPILASPPERRKL